MPRSMATSEIWCKPHCRVTSAFIALPRSYASNGLKMNFADEIKASGLGPIGMMKSYMGKKNMGSRKWREAEDG